MQEEKKENKKGNQVNFSPLSCFQLEFYICFESVNFTAYSSYIILLFYCCGFVMLISLLKKEPKIKSGPKVLKQMGWVSRLRNASVNQSASNHAMSHLIYN